VAAATHRRAGGPRQRRRRPDARQAPARPRGPRLRRRLAGARRGAQLHPVHGHRPRYAGARPLRGAARHARTQALVVPDRRARALQGLLGPGERPGGGPGAPGRQSGRLAPPVGGVQHARLVRRPPPQHHPRGRLGRPDQHGRPRAHAQHLLRAGPGRVQRELRQLRGRARGGAVLHGARRHGARRRGDAPVGGRAAARRVLGPARPRGRLGLRGAPGERRRRAGGTNRRSGGRDRVGARVPGRQRGAATLGRPRARR
jgi:hypothetical protein